MGGDEEFNLELVTFDVCLIHLSGILKTGQSAR